MAKFVLLVVLAFFPPFAFSAKCQGKDGNWYPYSDPHCDPSGTAVKKADKPSPIKSADAIMASGDNNLVQVEIFILAAAAQRIGDAQPEQGNTCLERYRSAFKDPRSAYVVASSIYENDVERFVHVDVSAKNGLGGNSRSYLVCTLPPD